MFQNVLVPLDGSPRAERALTYAERIATHFGSTLHLVRVVELPPGRTRVAGYDVDVKLLSRQVAEAIRYLETVGTQLGTTGHTVVIRVFTGEAAVALSAYEQAAAIDLVILDGPTEADETPETDRAMARPTSDETAGEPIAQGQILHDTRVDQRGDLRPHDPRPFSRSR